MKRRLRAAKVPKTVCPHAYSRLEETNHPAMVFRRSTEIEIIHLVIHFAAGIVEKSKDLKSYLTSPNAQRKHLIDSVLASRETANCLSKPASEMEERLQCTARLGNRKLNLDSPRTASGIAKARFRFRDHEMRRAAQIMTTIIIA